MSTSNYTNAQGNMGAFSKAKDLQKKILFVNQKIDSGINLSESLSQLKPPIFFLYINQFKNQVTKWETVLCYKAIERIMETEELCKLNSKISKIMCWRTLRNIASIKYN